MKWFVNFENIIYFQTPGDIDLQIQKQIQKATKRKLWTEIQPYIIVQGDKRNVENVYVIMDKIQYKCESVLKSIDLLFKLFFVLNIKYPFQSKHIWQLIENGIFLIQETENICPNIQDVLKYLNS